MPIAKKLRWIYGSLCVLLICAPVVHARAQGQRLVTSAAVSKPFGTKRSAAGSDRQDAEHVARGVSEAPSEGRRTIPSLKS